MDRKSEAGKDPVSLTLDPGVCGFPCIIEAKRIENRRAVVAIRDSGCAQVQRLSESLNEVGLRDLFAPISRNPVFVSAERAGCHPSCPVSVGIVKAVEVAMGMALPRKVAITFGDGESGE